MNISSIRSISGFQSYQSKSLSPKIDNQNIRPQNQDRLELSNKVLPNNMASYLDGSYLDDPIFEEKLNCFIEDYLL